MRSNPNFSGFFSRKSRSSIDIFRTITLFKIQLELSWLKHLRAAIPSGKLYSGIIALIQTILRYEGFWDRKSTRQHLLSFFKSDERLMTILTFSTDHTYNYGYIGSEIFSSGLLLMWFTIIRWYKKKDGKFSSSRVAEVTLVFVLQNCLSRVHAFISSLLLLRTRKLRVYFHLVCFTCRRHFISLRKINFFFFLIYIFILISCACEY